MAYELVNELLINTETEVRSILLERDNKNFKVQMCTASPFVGDMRVSHRSIRLTSSHVFIQTKGDFFGAG